VLSNIEKYIRYVEKIFIGIGGVLFMLMMFLGASDVIGRYFFNKPIQGTLEASEIMMGGIILLGWAYTMQVNGHVKVDLIVNHYKPRAQIITNLGTLILGLILFILIFWQSLILAIRYVNEHRVFQVLPGPAGPYHYFVPIGALFLCLELIIQIIQDIRKLRKGGAN